MSSKDELYDALKEVKDRKTFLEFARLLMEDWEDEQSQEREQPSLPYGPGANGWENGTIGMFLDGAISWAEASDFGDQLQMLTEEERRQRQASANDWKRFAEFLYAGKIYE